ncbi:MAG: zinc dependent phospholipase C family protein [Chloroflexi bacterium]|nr:zinc dependent phospholipase C family protein [Chloroflexota bacterium]
MPPLSLHTSLARRIAERLRTAVLDDERGNLYLGSTAPDIRVITRWERSRTHFFDLNNFEHQDAVAGFFSANPSLTDAAAVSPPTCAFIAGYVSHLVMDANWIAHIYRPFFGRDSELGGNLRANILDRAMQFSLDSETRDDDELMAEVLEAVARCDLELEIDFIDKESLRKWRQVVSDFAQSQPDWDRFKSRIRRHLSDTHGDALGDLDGDGEELARSLPELVNETLRYLSRERLDEWMNESLEESVVAVREYLRCV